MDGDRLSDRFLLEQIQATAVLIVTSRQRQRQKANRNRNHRSGTENRLRTRKRIESIYHELGDAFFRRAYRMEYVDFKKLCQLLNPYLNSITKSNGSREWGPNGRIQNQVRVACAIRYFAGGSMYDIMALFGLSESSFYASISMVVDAVNTCSAFQLRYPSCQQRQREIAQGFLKKSKAGFSCCAGAIDGLLIWINKPSKAQCEVTNQGQKKFYCGRKNKYGLNMQAVCDHHGRFLDVSIVYGGSSSDLLAFEASELYGRLKNDQVLAPGLCLFGDNAYVNSSFMATPYSGHITKEQDAYNFYHSQLRIMSECSFGRLVTRWGFLQKKAPQHFTIGKIIATVLCLCRLHNYCTDATLRRKGILEPPQVYDDDAVVIRLSRGIPLENRYAQELERTFIRPSHLLDGGNHQENGSRSIRRTYQRRQQRDDDEILPRELLLAYNTEKGNLRPQPLPQNNQRTNQR